jgi:type II pantothenate kinase
MKTTPDPGSGSAVGVDVGATLAKIAIRATGGAQELRLAPAEDLEPVAACVRQVEPATVGLTGGGAAALAALLGFDTARVNEFAAWGAGATAMLRPAAPPPGRPDRFLLVSVGTGTSAMLVDGLAVTRVGGTALGGGTVVGLGAALARTSGFDELALLARTGTRRHVDLLVSDIYRAGEIPLAGDLTAASFGKLGREGWPPPSRADLARAIMGLVGENVALICAGLAAAAQVGRVVYGGCTLRDNPALCEVLLLITSAMGREARLLPDGEFAGALGALLLAAQG